MNTYANPNSAFPSQTVPDAEKASKNTGDRLRKLLKANGGDKVVMELDLLHHTIDFTH